MTTPAIANYTGGVEIEGKLYYGMDAESMLKMQAKFDYKLEKELWAWIEACLGETLRDGKDLGDVLRSGTVLCRLANRIEPGAVKLRVL